MLKTVTDPKTGLVFLVAVVLFEYQEFADEYREALLKFTEAIPDKLAIDGMTINDEAIRLALELAKP